jgi:hypothetical protein
VSYGGVSVSLGGTDATPAFDLADATNYPTSSLTGTITNSQLAGSIANGKLSNSSVSYGGVSVSLGGTDATPAFDLADATNYPTSSLTGTITTSQLANNAVTTAKLADITQGSILVGGASNAPTVYDANDDGKILVGDGTDIASVAVSGDVTLANTGAVTIADDAVTTVKINDANVTTAKIANSAVILTTKVAGVLPIANGGTGATNADAANSALNSLGIFTGTGTISSGNGATVTISDSNVTSSSKIFLTFTSDTDGGPYFVDNLSSGSFRVTAATLQGGGTFNYLVINIP